MGHRNTNITRVGSRVFIVIDYDTVGEAEEFCHNAACQVLDKREFSFRITNANVSDCTCSALVHPWSCNKPGICSRRQACR